MHSSHLPKHSKLLLTNVIAIVTVYNIASQFLNIQCTVHQTWEAVLHHRSHPPLLKHIYSLSGFDKRNHDCHGVWKLIISTDVYGIIYTPGVFSLVLVWIGEKCLLTFLSTSTCTSKFIKNTPLYVIFSTPVSVFGNATEHCLSYLII